ncbi:unnamed protein product [Spirodela intermedia]|uniref:Mediator of RNA polymerase II transcription subunit 13 n=1 Tax=Spirodela intermedia TaxID=51605 RepID=A0A7I8J0L4_SPIIN|nr:unnamed protein product [Spirodela intermedia]CAA6663353.1 unnamed protein product [Spirodela intermedia]
MWTNVFKIGGLQLVSWFQFLPYEFDPSSLPEKSHRSEERDATTLSILSSHLQLQNEGFLSTWTNSFVGPWDPSQGVHNPDEKIKLWLFLPGCHSSVSESAHAAVSRLRVIASGVWSAPGDSEEVALALSQSLRNRIERSLRTLSYVRFGDVFTKCDPFSSSEKNFRRLQPTFEFVFAATEEAIFVHVVVSAKHIRGLPEDDVKRALKYLSYGKIGEGLPVITAPNGLRGRLVGGCPSDLVKQVYLSKVTSSNGFSALDTPFHFAQYSGCRLKGQNCYVEVAVGSTLLSEAILVPVLYKAFAKSSPKRFWLQNWLGTTFSDVWTLWDSSDPSLAIHSLELESAAMVEPISGVMVESASMSNGAAMVQQRYNSSSNSNGSSLSSISSTSSGSENVAAVGTRDLEADADSVACRQSGLSRNEHVDNNDRKMVSKRSRTGIAESCDQAGTFGTETMQETYKSEYSVVEANSSAAAIVTNDGIGSYWDLADDDGDYGINIQSLLSEFGDFGDFFVNDNLCFGEPPGTAESQALVVAADIGAVNGSPSTTGMDIQDQSLIPVGFSSFESLSDVLLTKLEEADSKHIDNMRGTLSAHDDTNSSAPSSDKFSFLSKAEAMMTFAPEYAAVETVASELPMPIFRTLYLPKSKRVESSHSCSGAYSYNATPPPSPLVEPSEEKSEVSVKGKLEASRLDGSSPILSSLYYTHVQRGSKRYDKSIVHIDDDLYSHKEDAPSSISGISLSSTSLRAQGKKTDSILEVGDTLLSRKTSLATEVECMMLQAAMCRIRHTLLSCPKQIFTSLTKQTGIKVSDQRLSETSPLPDLISGRSELRKKDSVPVRIAGDIDGGALERTLNSPVGVWRSVGAAKGTKSLNAMKGDSASSLLQNTFVEESLSVNVQSQPLQVLLDALPLVVQQSTSFVDIALDSYDGEEPYCWLALQEQQRRGFSCGPLMAHAGCGGLLAACHSVDIAGVDLNDPLSADVHASFVASLLQSDVKVALKNAFGSLDGPLALTDWCKGRNQASDSVTVSDGFSVDCIGSEIKESSSITLRGKASAHLKFYLVLCHYADGTGIDDPLQRRTYQDASNSELEQPHNSSRFRATISLIPFPSLLVGYQDDWLKTSSSSLELWEKGPLEPYALPKPMTYYAICPDVDLLSSAAIDFFLQLGTVYETCKLGTHSPHGSGGQMDQTSGKCSSSGLVLVDCPQSLKVASSNISAISSMTDFFVALESGWDVKSFLKALTKALKNLKLGSSSGINQKEIKGGSCVVVYVVCPFPEPTAVLQTLVEASAALGSIFFSSDKERRSVLHSQVTKALSCASAADEASVSSVLMLSGFNISKLVLQIVTVDSLLRFKPGNELAMLKEYAFTVYNKARRIPRASTGDVAQSAIPGRPQSSLMHMSATMQAGLARDSEIDATLRSSSWDSSWQTVRSFDSHPQDDVRLLFEPLFILSEPSSVDQGISHVLPGGSLSEPSTSRAAADDGAGAFIQASISGGSADASMNSHGDGPENDPKAPSLHCCYGWTEDWRWLVCVWTDSRGELLDSQVIPFGGISSRQDTKLLQSLFVQILHQGCQILSWSSDSGTIRPRDIIISRIGFFFELERQVAESCLLSGGNEVKKWAVQLRRSAPDGIGSGHSGASLQQDMGSIAERPLPSSPSPHYSPHAKLSYMKSGSVQSNAKKQLLSGQTTSISLVSVLIDHSLQLMLPADVPFSGGTPTIASSSHSGYLEGFSPVKSLGSIPAAYIFVPSMSLHYLPTTPLQLPTSLTSESPPLAHLLHSKGPSIPLTSAFVVSKAVPSGATGGAATNEEWPSILLVTLVDHYGSSSGSNSSNIQEKLRASGGGGGGGGGKQPRISGPEVALRGHEMETSYVMEMLAAELHSLSWLTVSPLHLRRRTPLPFHCDMVLRLRRLLHYADRELSRLAAADAAAA